jgi:hypothetical protein
LEISVHQDKWFHFYQTKEQVKIMKRLAVILVTVVALVGFMTAGSALAITYNGALWDPDYAGNPGWNANANNPSLGAPLDPATATFTVGSINFSFGPPEGETYGAWLAGFTAVSEPSLGWIATTPFYTPSTNQSPYLGTFFQFTWQETFSTDVLLAISLTHDDGAYLIMDGTTVLINSSAPTTVITDTFSGLIAVGLHTFELNYGGVNGFPEVLPYSASTTPVPLPPSALLLGSGLLGLVGLGWRRRKVS